jgi:hypothetical protein
MPKSQEQTLLDAVAVALAGIGSAIVGWPIPILVFKANEVRPLIETVPVFTVAGAEGGSRERAFTGSWWVKHAVRVTLISNGNLDLLTDLGTYLNWREALTDLFEEPSGTGVPSVANVEVDESKAPVDPALLSQGYDVSSIRFVFTNLEDHG